MKLQQTVWNDEVFISSASVESVRKILLVSDKMK